jgi:predicted acylesterase/phospholipase RssA
MLISSYWDFIRLNTNALKSVGMLKHLVFAGGGPRILVFLSSVEVLAKKDMLTNIKHYWGNSSGALLATLLSMNTPLPKIRTIFETFEFTKLRDIDLANLMGFGDSWGLDSGVAFVKHVREVLEDVKPGSSDYTLQELPSLHITATDLTLGKPVILDSKTMPTLKVVDALRASTSIPFFYKPFRNPVNNHLMVDGAVACNFPWTLLPSDAVRAEALGFDYQLADRVGEPASISEYIPAILSFRERLWNVRASKPAGPNILRFHVTGFPAWHLALKKEDRDELFRIGYDTTTTWLTQRYPAGTNQTPPSSAGQRIQQQASPSGHTSGLSGSRGYQRPSQDSSQGLPSQYPLSRRRWSW